ncbi:hypothetical protein QUF90_07535 [Desulfococcaceae bacterium HSG9]|nr:hypothetical protein [Desulfococcaceae bacterium HSG9]
MSQKINELFQNARDDGLITQNSMNALTVADIGAQIQNALGVSVDDVQASEAVLVTMMPDDSGSIRFNGNSQVVRDGHNTALDALLASGQKDNILVHTRYLNGKVLYPYTSLANTKRMDRRNYNPNEGTPLYDQTIVLLGTVLAKAQDFADNGLHVRTVTLIITDGSDQHSVRAKASDVKALTDDMLATEDHIIAAMGIDDGLTDFNQVFTDMGIRDEWILTPGNSASEIRSAFNLFSQSAVRASQSVGGFGNASMGGFGGS